MSKGRGKKNNRAGETYQDAMPQEPQAQESKPQEAEPSYSQTKEDEFESPKEKTAFINRRLLKFKKQ